jgi:thymidylate synthase
MSGEELKGVQKMLKDIGPEKTFERARAAARRYVHNLRDRGRLSFSDPREGDLPSVHLVRRTIPQAWEDMSMAIIGIGAMVHTHYDPGHKTKQYESFPSMEVTGTLHITEPFGEPRFHKHYLGGWLGFGDYRAEIEGVKDCMVMDPKVVAELLKKGKFGEIRGHKGWLYSYSQRFRSYPFIDIRGEPQTINQLQSVITNLSREPTSRSAQCVTWDPRFDHNDGQIKYADEKGQEQSAVFEDYHAPCLQSLWFRLEPFKDGYKLNVNSRFRSHCHLKGLPSNFYGLLEGMVEPVRVGIQNELKVPVERGRLFNVSDTLHVYGHYIDPRKQGLDAQAYLEDVFRIAAGQPIVNRLIVPGTVEHDAMREDVEKEYQFRKANPTFGMNM